MEESLDTPILVRVARGPGRVVLYHSNERDDPRT